MKSHTGPFEVFLKTLTLHQNGILVFFVSLPLFHFQAPKALARLPGCTGFSISSLLISAVRTKILCTGSFIQIGTSKFICNFYHDHFPASHDLLSAFVLSLYFKQYGQDQ